MSSASSKHSHLNYRPDIDGLRALAVVPVILFHAGFQTFSGGFVGVDVFFVISGYLITTNILNELEQGRFSIANFYERRARRILPALFFMMLCCLPFAWLWLLPQDMKSFSRSLVAVTTFVSNIFFWKTSGYFDTATELKPMLHTWSLSVEEQFYVLFPLLLMFSWRLGKKLIGISIIVIAIFSLLLSQHLSATKPMASFYLLPTRAWELMVGAMVAFYYTEHNINRHKHINSQLGGLLGFVLICFSIFVYDKQTPFPSFYTLAPTIGAALIIAFNTKHTIVGWLFGSKLFVGIGLVSYSAYLWHQPVFAFARHRSIEEPSKLLLSGLALASVVVAYFSWQYVEKPFRRRRSFNRKQVFLFGSTVSVAFILLGLIGYKSNVFDYRLKRVLSGDVGQIEFHQHIQDRYYDCEPSAIAEQALSFEGYLRCKQTKKGIPDVVLLGDSHAEHLFLGLAENKKNHNVAFYILDGKPYVKNQQFKIIFDELLSESKPQYIVLTMFFGRVTSDESDIYEGFSTTIKALQAAGKFVSLVGDVPFFKQNPAYCAYEIPSKKMPSSCFVSMEDVKAQKKVYHSVLHRLSAEYNVNYIDIDFSLCSDNQCAIANEQYVLYRDEHHLNIPGSKLVGKYLADKLAF